MFIEFVVLFPSMLILVPNTTSGVVIEEVLDEAPKWKVLRVSERY